MSIAVKFAAGSFVVEAVTYLYMLDVIDNKIFTEQVIILKALPHQEMVSK